MAWLSLKTLFQLLLEFFTFFNKNKLIIAEQIKCSNKWSYLTIDVFINEVVQTGIATWTVAP